MANDELLLAISGLLEPIRNDIRDMKSDIRDISYEVRELRNDVEMLKTDVRILTNRVDVLTDRVDEITIRVDRLENSMSDVQTRLIRMELTQENVIIPRLETIESCYTSTYNRYKSGVKSYKTIKPLHYFLMQYCSNITKKRKEESLCQTKHFTKFQPYTKQS